MVVDVCKRLAVCEARMSQALSLQAKFVKDFETVKDSAIPGVFDKLLRIAFTYIFSGIYLLTHWSQKLYMITRVVSEHEHARVSEFKIMLDFEIMLARV